jgi:predicted secreted protein
MVKSVDILSLFFVYCLIWWVVFFVTLPIGIVVEKKHKSGHADSAPKNTYLWKKLFATSFITLLITIAIAYSVKHGYIVGTFDEFINKL